MMEHENSPNTPGETQGGQPVVPSHEATPHVSAGTLIRTAREKAGITAAKLCSDLRIAPATLAALEAGNYGALAGPPYVRAMLVSVSRYLRIETRDVLKAYAEEAGGQEPAAASPISPYKDDSGTHAKAHKQIFILLLAVLLFILLLIMGKVNTSSPEPEPVAPAVPTDTLLNIEPPGDSLPADSLGAPLTDSLAVTDTTATEGAAQEDFSAGNLETRVRIVALTDSVWLRILPAGARESSLYLRLDRAVDFNHDDVITFITRRGGMVRVIAGDNELVPSQRRFKVDGDQITE